MKPIYIIAPVVVICSIGFGVLLFQMTQDFEHTPGTHLSDGRGGRLKGSPARGKDGSITPDGVDDATSAIVKDATQSVGGRVGSATGAAGRLGDLATASGNIGGATMIGPDGRVIFIPGTGLGADGRPLNETEYNETAYLSDPKKAAAGLTADKDSVLGTTGSDDLDSDATDSSSDGTGDESSTPKAVDERSAILGTVFDGETGQPIAGAQVIATKITFNFSLESLTLPTVTDGAGGFQLGNLLLNEEYDISVTADGYAPGYRRGVLVPNPSVDIPLYKGASVTGRVFAQTDGGTEPAPGALVYARDEEARIAAQTSAGPDGSYQIDALAPGRYELLATLDNATSVDLNSQRGRPVEIARGQTQSLQVDLTLHTGGSLKGTVTDNRGTPLPDASVDLYMMRKSNQQWEKWDSLTTDPSGAFAFVGLPSGRYYMSVRKANYGELRYSSEYIIGLGESLDGLLLQLQAASAISGRVTEEGGYALPGVLVRVEGSDCSGVSDSEGIFSLNCVGQGSGRVNLVLTLIGYETTKITDVEVGSTELEFVLRRGGIVRGRVMDKGIGSGIPGARLQLWEMDLSGNRSGNQSASASTGSDGVYEFRGVTLEVPFEIEVSCEGYEPQKKEDFMSGDGQLTIDFELESGCVLTGIAVNLRDNQPIPDVEIRAAYGDKVKRTNSDSAGEFSVSGLPRAQVTLRVYHREFGSSFSISPDAEAKDFQIIALADSETDVTIYMKPGVSLRGTVTARDFGAPVAGVQVSEISSGRFTQTGQDGFYILDGLPAQQGLRLVIIADGYEEIFLDPQKLRFPVGMHELSFQVGRGGTIRGRVTPMSGDFGIFLQRINRGDPEEFYARAYCAQPDWEYAIPAAYKDPYISPEGYYNLTGLTAGTYVIRVYRRPGGENETPLAESAPFHLGYEQNMEVPDLNLPR